MLKLLKLCRGKSSKMQRSMASIPSRTDICTKTCLTIVSRQRALLDITATIGTSVTRVPLSYKLL